MLSPALYGHTALGHGTVAVVADPHEIANVCGTDGIRYMVEQARRTPLKIHYTVPSCVPATPFETSGATLDSRTVEELLESGVFVALGEMMNYPGVLGGDDQCIRKIEAARRRGIPVDGHAPLLEGADLRRYIGTGISTDHESCSLPEAREKIDAGMMIQIREGSQSREFDTLIPLLGYRPDRVMLCTDDLKASGLSRGHINRLVSRAVALGYDLFDVLAAATLNPIRHYRLKVGLLQPGDPADLICCPDLIHFTPSQVWIDGKRVDTLPAPGTDRTVNHFLAEPITTGIIATSSADNELLRVIRPEEGTLITGEELIPAGEKGRYQKMIVLNRYAPHAPAAIGYVSRIQPAGRSIRIDHRARQPQPDRHGQQRRIDRASRKPADRHAGRYRLLRPRYHDRNAAAGRRPDVGCGSRDGHPAIRPDRTAYPRTGLSLLHSGHAARLPGSSGDPVAQAHRPGTLRRDPVRICLNKGRLIPGF